MCEHYQLKPEVDPEGELAPIECGHSLWAIGIISVRRIESIHIACQGSVTTLQTTQPNLTLKSLTLYIYGAPILDVSRSHTTTQHSR